MLTPGQPISASVMKMTMKMLQATHSLMCHCNKYEMGKKKPWAIHFYYNAQPQSDHSYILLHRNCQWAWLIHTTEKHHFYIKPKQPVILVLNSQEQKKNLSPFSTHRITQKKKQTLIQRLSPWSKDEYFALAYGRHAPKTKLLAVISGTNNIHKKQLDMFNTIGFFSLKANI